MTKELKLGNSSITALVDDYKFEELSKYSWNILYRKNTPIGIRTNYGGGFYLHRIILKEFNSNIFIDHRDGNIFNNLVENLRIATNIENLQNSKIRKDNISGYKGVHFENFTKKWKAAIMVNKKLINLGRFKCKILAAISYDDAAIKYFGEFARLNFPLYGA